MTVNEPAWTESPEPARRWARLALWLVGLTMAYNALEAVIAGVAGIEAHSIALVGFGLDSVIELAAGGMLLWRLAVEARGADAGKVEQAEGRVRRFVGYTFFALALYVLVESSLTLLRHRPPEKSWWGIGLAVASLVIMPAVAWAKLAVARRMRSAALRAEARETLACAWLSLALLVGLLANAVLGWWWADPVAALLMLPWLVKEGLENVRGEEDEDDDRDDEPADAG